MTVPPLVIDQDRFCATTFSGSTVRVLNWNIAKQGHVPNWQRDFFKLLITYQPDLLFLQEVSLSEAMQQALDETHLGWVFTPNVINTWQDLYAGVLIGSAVMPRHSYPLLTTVYEPVSNTPKVSLIAEYALPDREQTLLAVNVHGINFVSTAKFNQQLAHLQQALAQHEGPIILAGDFNTWNQARLQQLFALATALQLKHVNFEPMDRQHIRRFLLSPPLDHIFYRGFRERQHSSDVLQRVRSSDHKPMFVELVLE